MTANGSTSFYKIETTQWAQKRKVRFAAYLLDQVFTFLEPESFILEIGPGLGHLADECIKRNHRYIAIEPSTSMSNRLRARGVNVRTQEAPPIHFDNNVFDFIIANHVLEHQPSYKKAVLFIKEMYRTLRPGGYGMISFPNWNHTNNFFFEMDYSHGYITTRYRVSQLLASIGLEIKKYYYTNGQVPLHEGLIGLLIRFPYLCIQFIVNRRIIGSAAELFNKEDFLFKIRKTVSESIYMVVQKPLIIGD